MQNRLHVLEKLTFEQAACAVLDLKNCEENPRLYASYINQLCDDAESAKLEGAIKAAKMQPLPLFFTTNGDGKNIKNNSSRDLEYNSQSTVPRLKFIGYLNTNGCEVPACLNHDSKASKSDAEWSKEVAALEVEIDRLKGLTGEFLPVNATQDMRTCIEVSQKYWTNTCKDEDRDTWMDVETIVNWIVGERNVSLVRAQAIQKVTRPEWAATGGRKKKEF